MAIQFRCAACQQPIEVDDQYANQSAECPYCRKVITVPGISTLADQPPAAARPSAAMPPVAPPPPGALAPHAPPPQSTEGSGASPPPWERPASNPPPPKGWDPSYVPPPAFPSLHVNATNPQKLAAAHTYGNYALVCLLLQAVFVALIAVAMFAAVAGQIKNLTPGSQPTTEQMEAVQKEFQNSTLTMVAFVGSCFFAVVGTALSITSLRLSTTSNGRAWLALVFCGAYSVCCCGGQALGYLVG